MGEKIKINHKDPLDKIIKQTIKFNLPDLPAGDQNGSTGAGMHLLHG